MNKLFLIVFFMSFTLILFESCEKEEDDDEKSETKISSIGSNESHNAGLNCMTCHKIGGSGEGFFNIAGTVYDTSLAHIYPNSLLKLYSGPNATGELKHQIEVDAKGNFYSTEEINFDAGLYVSLTGSISTEHMFTKLPNGQCNSCHGNNIDRIWIK